MLIDVFVYEIYKSLNDHTTNLIITKTLASNYICVMFDDACLMMHVDWLMRYCWELLL